MKRRTLLAVSGAVTVPILAGCLDNDDPEEGDSGGTETDGPNNETDAPETNGGQDDETNGEQDDETDDSTAETDGEPPFTDSFAATSQGGFLAIDEDTERRSTARAAGFVLPDGEEVLTLEAVVADDGTWESTAAQFPTVQIDDPITTDILLELPDGLTGSISENRMTASGEIRVVIEALDEQFSFEINATSDKSGTLEGEIGFDEEPMSATLVDNEFTIEDSTGNLLVDGQLGLPAEEPGTNWFEFEVELTGA